MAFVTLSWEEACGHLAPPRSLRSPSAGEQLRPSVSTAPHGSGAKLPS